MPNVAVQVPVPIMVMNHQRRILQNGFGYKQESNACGIRTRFG